MDFRRGAWRIGPKRGQPGGSALSRSSLTFTTSCSVKWIRNGADGARQSNLVGSYETAICPRNAKNLPAS